MSENFDEIGSRIGDQDTAENAAGNYAQSDGGTPAYAGSSQVVQPAAGEAIVLPAGTSIAALESQGRDLVIVLDNGDRIVVPDGAIYVPQIVVGDTVVPPINVAALLNDAAPQPAAGAPQSSGGNFYVDPGSIQAAYGLGDLLPYTELAFGEQPDDEEYQYIDREADIVITTPDNPVGAVAVMGIVDEAGLPARGSEPAGTEFATDSETITGTIVFDVPDGLGSITLNGVAITQVGQTFVTEYGVLTITSISGNVIGYSYTLTDNLLGQDVSDQFIAVVTDVDGDSATATLVIDVIDDHPIARSDTDTVAAGTYGPESGNVMTGEGTTSGAAGADVEGADSASVTSVSNTDGDTVSAGDAPMVIEGEYGTLTLYADGHYDYVRAAGTPGGVSDVFTYTLTDDDGSTASATLTINIADAPVVIISVPEVGDGTVVDEDGLPPRGDEPPGSEEIEDGDPDNNSDDGEETSGTITFSPGDGPAVVTIGGVVVTGPGQVIPLPEGTLTIVNYDPVAGEIDYTFTLTDNTSGDDTSVTFTVTVTDVDGDTDSADITIHIIDDEPEAVDDFGSQTSENASVTVDAFANDTPGADGVAFDDIEYVEDSLSGTGTVTYNGDGTFTYTPGPGEQGTVTFDYSITDGDGDVSTATVTIRLLDDSTPTLSIEGDNTVDEAGLPARDGEPAGSGEGADGNPTNNSDTSEFAEGTITTDTGGDTIRSLVINDVDVTDGGTVTTSKGVLTVTDNGDGTYGYVYRLTDNTLSDPDSDTFTVRLTDSDNDSVTSTLVIGIADDTPEAFSDPDIFVSEDATDPVGGDLLDDDTQGADGATVTSVTIGGVEYDIAESGTTTITTTNGTYKFTAGGTWSFLPSDGLDQSDGAVDASFTYEITDGDDDTSSADQGIYITDGEGPEAGPDIALRVDDENLADGSDPAVPVTSADDIVFTPGSDPIASVVFGDVGDLGGGLDWVRVDDDTITGSDGGRLVITLQLGTTTNADGTVTATVTATLNDEYNDHLGIDVDDLADLGTVDVIASDGETGAAADSVTATVSVAISDDLPTISAGAPGADALTVDESDFATDATADFSGLFTPDYNADNPGTVSGYTLGISAGSTGLVDTLSDENVVLVMNGATVEGRTEGSNLLVFVVSVDADGIVTLDQRRAVEHSDPNDDNDPAHFASGDLITLSATATDSDGDTDTATVGIGNAFTFLDDGPSLTDVAVGSSVMLDETDAGSPGGFPITVDSADPIVSFGSDYGADDGGTTTFEIAVVGGGASGLSTAQGDYPITLVQTSPTLITGTYNGGLTAFTIQINADGTLTLTQQVPLEHTDPTDDNDVLDLAGLIDATVTVTDDDGDSVSDTVGIGGAISFYDDGPSIDANVDDAGNAVTLTTYDEQTIGAATDTDVSTADFSGAFTVVSSSGGGDGTADISWAYDLQIENAVSNLEHEGLTINLYMDGDDVVGSTATDAGSVGTANTVFRISVDPATGVVTLSQYMEIDHALPGDTAAPYDDQLAILGDNLVNLVGTATITDNDGDQASEEVSLDLGGNIQFADDGPSLTDVAVGSSVMLDETDAGSPGGFPITVDSADPIVSFGSDYGADDGGTTTFEIAVVGGGASGLSTAQGDYPITLVQTSPTLITGTYNGGLTAFTIQINADGTLTLTQQVPLEHTDPTDDNDVLDLAGLIDATVTVTDDDGDSVSDTVGIGGAISFYDDGPSIDANVDDAGNAVTLTTYDEQTIGAATDTDVSTADFSGAFTVVSSSGGGDGTADISWAYDLQIENAVSNLEHEGLTINLYMDGDDVVGSTATDAGSVGTANTVFRISVDPATGVVTLSQYMEIDHALPGDTAAPYDDQLAILGDNLVNLVGTATITDNDGDQASEEVSLDLGGNIQFADDGPSLTDVAVGSSVMLDETDAGSPGGFPITVDSADPIVSFGSDYGADDGGTTTFEIAVVGGGASGLSTAQGDYPITLVQTSPTLITGTYNGGLTAFTIQINADGTLTLTQQVPLEHTDPTDDNDVLDLAGLIDATVTVTDDDGDSVSDTVGIGGAISLYDDGPSVSANLVARLDEDDLPDGIDGGIGDQDAQNLSGVLGHDYGGDGEGSIAFLTTGAPTGFQYVASGDDLLIQQDQGGSWVTVVTVTLDPSSGAYSISQDNPILHADGSNENNQNFSIGYQVTDADGDTATGNLTLVVDDDTPEADGSAALTGSVDEDGLDDGVPGGGNDIAGEALSDTGSVTGMFSPGADGPLTYSLDTDTSVLDALNLSSGSTPLTYAVVGDTLTAYAGATEVFTFELTSGGTWTFTLKAPLDHADDGANDDNATDIAIDFGSLIVGTDADNDPVNATGSLIVTVDDDSPDAVDDANAIGEDGTTVGGNVLLGNDGTDGTADDDRFGGDGPGDPKIVSVVGDNGSGGIDDVVDGTYGTLQIGSDGSYTYTLDPSTVQSLDDGDKAYDTFTYTIVDADGDESTAQVVITINGANDAPVLAADTNWIQDVDGAVPDPTTTGNVLQNVDHTRPAGGDYADVADTDVDAGDVLQVTDLTGTGPGSGINTAVGGTYGSLQIDADGNYTYTLDADNATVDGLNVGDAPLTDTFTYTVSDGTVTDTQTVTIYIYGTNAAPVVTGDAVAVSEEGLPGGIPDDDPIVPADADTTDSKTASGSIGITDIDDTSFTVTLGEPLQTLNAADGTPLTWDVSADGKTLKGYSTDIGNPEITVVIADDGTYNVTLGGPIEHGDDTVEDTTFFVVPVSVSDGSSTTDLANGITVTIEDDSPEVSGNLPARLDEDDLAGGIDGGIGDQDAQNLSGVLGHDYGGDGAGSIAFLTTGAPTGFQYVASGDDLLIQQDQGGSWVTVVTVTLDPSSGAYSISQDNPILHADGGNENNQNFSIGYQVTDADGDTATGNLTLVVDDDTPVANPDTDTVSEGGSTSGNVVTDAEANGDNGADGAGADGFAASPTGIVTGIASVNQGTSDTTVNGSENYVLDGEFGTLTLNRDGTYTYESDPNSISTTEHDVFEYTVIDADGDTSTTTLTIEVTPVALVGDDESVTVYEEAMDTTEDAGDVAASTVTGTSPGDTTESATGTVTVTGTGVEYSISGGSVSGNLTTVVGMYGTLVLNNDTGAFTYTLTSAYAHTPGVNDGVTTQPDAEQFTYTATDDDGNTTTGTISVNIVDDVPLPLVTEKAVLSNSAGLPASFDLDSDGNVDDNTGADQTGTVRFLSSIEGETGLSSNGSPIYYYLSDDGQTLVASTSATDPFPLGAPPDTTDWVFRVDINQDLDVSASTDQYTVQMYDKVDSIGQVEFTDGTYDFVGGNTHWVGYVPLNQKTTPVDDDSSDLLITPIVNGDTANGNANEIGSGGAGGGSLGVGPNQGLRLDFVVDLTGNPTSGGGGYVSPSNHTFDRHYTVPSAAIEFSVGSGPNKLGEIQLIAYDDPDYVNASTPDADDTVGDVVTWDNINQVIISYGGSTATTADDAEFVIDTSAPGSYDIDVIYGGVTYTLHKSADGSVTYDGIKTGIVVAVFTSDGSYTTLEARYQGGDEFTITGIGTSVITNTPVEIAVPIELVDSDGDITPSYLDLTFEPSAGTQDFSASGTGVTATATNANPNLIGSDFNDTLTGNGASNWIAGGLGQDTLTGGAGKDYFVIDPSHLAAAADDIITDYAAGDIIDLRALISSLGSDAGNATVRLFGNSLQVDPDGAGTDFGWLNVATLSNNPTSVDVLLEYGESAVTFARIAPPVVLDLDGDGAEFVGLEAGIGYDYNGDGVAEGTAWVGADDAILAYDANGDGTVSNAGEFVFGTGGSSDLEAIAAQFDDNGDGVLDASDAAYAAFGIWQDANQNGVADAGEFTTLEDAGITAISLTSDGHAYSAANDDVSVSGSSVFTWSNGSTGTVADAGFLTGEQRTSQRTTEYAVSAAAIGGFFTYAMPGDHLPAKMFDFGDSRSADDFRVGLETHSTSPTSHYEPLPSAAFAPAASEAASLAAPQESGGHGPDGGDDDGSASLPDAGQSTQALPLEAAAWDSGVDTASHGGGSGSPDQVMDALLTMQLATTEASQGDGNDGAPGAITPQDLPEVAAVLDDVMAGQQVDQIIDALAPEAGPGDAAGLATLGTQVDFHAMISGDAFAFAGMDPMTMVDDHAAAAPAA